MDEHAESMLARLIEAVPGGVVHVGPEGAIVRANVAASQFLGFSYDELTERFTQDFPGATIFEDGTPCGPESYPITQALTTGQPAGPTTIGVTQPSGEVRWAVFRAVPLEGGGAVATFLDITERRAAERRLRRSDRLASLGRLAAGVAHEINNPLTWAMLSLEQARRREHDPAVDTAYDGLQRVARIVRDLGRFSRSDQEPPEAFDVHDAIDVAISMARGQIQHRARLELSRGNVPLAMGADAHTVQILVNLLLNAAQSIPPGNRDEHTIVVSTHAAPGEVQIRITDTGCGMPDDTREHAFDPFFTTKGVGEGTGLGLAISHELASSMGGTLELDSRHGQGTTVVLTLAAAEPTPVVSTATTPIPAPGRASSVLVVDDEPAICRQLTAVLAPHDVTTATNGREALELVKERDFDAIVCDLMMPEVTGMRFHQELTQVAPQLVDRVVFVTGGAYTKEARAFTSRPDIVCVMKPFRINLLRRAVADRIAGVRT